MNRIYALSLSVMLSLTVWAQESSYRLADATQLWRLTDNAAGLGIDSSANRGYALFTGEHRSGDYARVQEGTQQNQLLFQAEHYQRLGKWLHAYGRFDFDYGRVKNRAWADVRRPYNSDPYFAGNSVSGKYDFQDFDFTAALGTTDLGGWRFGLRLDYSVGDLSRLRDPRSRSQLLDYQLTPAVTRTFGRHSVGLSGHYHRYKEKITGVTTVQQDPTLKYYLMTGMEHAEGTTGGYASFSREWVDHRFGAALSHGYQTDRHLSLLTASIERGSEDIFGQYRYEPGHFVDYRYALSVNERVRRGHLLHQLDAAVAARQAYADEYRQQLQQEKEAETGYTTYYYTNQLTYKKRYQVRQLDAGLHYRLSFLRLSENGTPDHSLPLTAYLGASVATTTARNRYLLPQSDLKYGGLDMAIEGGTQLLGGHLWLDILAMRHQSTSADLTLSDPTTDYAVQVLLPDMDFYDASYWRGRLALTWQFPLKLKGKRSFWFVRAYGDYLKTNNSLDAKSAGLCIGLYN